MKKKSGLRTKKGRLAAVAANYHVRFDGQFDAGGGLLLQALLANVFNKRKSQGRK